MYNCVPYSDRTEYSAYAEKRLKTDKVVKMNSCTSAFPSLVTAVPIVDLPSLMMQLPNSREKWFSEWLGIEAVSRDFGDPNLFLTISHDPCSTYNTGALLYKLKHGKEMLLHHPDEKNTERFTDLVSRFAPQTSN